MKHYFRLELKRAFNILPRFLGSIFFIVLLVAGSIVGMSAILHKTQVIKPIQLGVVLEGEQTTAKMLIDTLPEIESVKKICEFSYYDEESAMNELKDGKLQAVVVLSEHFLGDIMDGTNTPAKIVLGNEISVNTKLFQELLKDGVSLLRTSEAALYAVTDVAHIYEMAMSRSNMENMISYLYLNKVLGRNALFDNIMISENGTIELAHYYYIAGMLVVLLFAGVSFSFLFQKREHALEKKLKVYGVRSYQIILTKILVMFMMLWGLSVIIYGFVFLIKSFLPFDFKLPSISILLFVILLTISMASFFGFLFMITGRSSKSGIILMLINLILMLTSGLLIPIQLLPKFVQKFSLISPVRYWCKYLVGCVGNKPTWSSIAVIIMIAMISYGGAVIRLCKDT